jgi:hypothetical protein
MGVRPLALTVLALLLVPTASAAKPAGTAWVREAQSARAALTRSFDAGYLSAAEQRRYRGVLAHARVVHGRVPPLRAQLLEKVLAQVADRKSPTAPQALTLYGTLTANVDYLVDHRVPADGVDVVGADGIVYRSFYRRGLQFHPLANAGRLNALFAAGDTAGAQELSESLSARAVPRQDGAAVWEYPFDFGTLRAPWKSGMAQAVMAQALARVGDTELARRAFSAIPRSLDRKLPAGPWIRLYSGRSDVILNAQLQSAISIGDYGELTGDSRAKAYATRMLAAAKSLLPRFDTGHWTRYALGVESNLHYQDYVIDLLKLLAKRTGDPVWTDTADRFELYETQPPLMTGPTVTRLVYPLPEDGVRDSLVTRFWLSKPSKVALVVDGKAIDGNSLTGGWHTFRVTPLGLEPGSHVVRLVANSADGNPGETDLGSFVVARDTSSPLLAASKSGGRVFWRAKDGESACCRIRIVLRRGSGRQVLAPSRTNGSVGVPAGYWLVTAIALDAAGNASQKTLGLVIGARSAASS